MSRPLEVSAAELDGIWVIGVKGEIDLATLERVQAHLDAAFADGRRFLVLDLTLVSFLDSAMLHALTRAVRRARLAGGDVAVACADPTICRVLEVFGLTGLRVYDTAAEAGAALRVDEEL